jgi:hypothetical protein
MAMSMPWCDCWGLVLPLCELCDWWELLPKALWRRLVLALPLLGPNEGFMPLARLYDE